MSSKTSLWTPKWDLQSIYAMSYLDLGNSIRSCNKVLQCLEVVRVGRSNKHVHGISLIWDKQTLPYPIPYIQALPPTSSLFIQIYCSSSSLCNKTCRSRRREDKMQTTSGLEKLFCVGRTYKKLLGLHRQTHQPWISDVVLQKHQQSPYWEKNCLSLNKPTTGLLIHC